jgi:hypothetical protein
MKIKRVLTIVLLLIVWNNQSNSQAKNYYVDATSGSDANNGLSPSSAWKTLERINAAPFTPGDSILFKREATFRGTLIPQSGSASGNITYGAYGTGSQPNIGQLFLSGKKHITISNILMLADLNHEALLVDHCSDLTFEGITADGQKIMNCNRTQIASFSFSYNITIRNSTIKNGGNMNGTDYGGGLGINSGCHDFLVEGNLVFNHAEHCMQCGSYDDLYPDYNIKFRGNTVYNEEGYYNDCRGINVGWRSYNVIVERNNVSNTKTFLIETDSYTHDVIIRNNMLFYTIDSGSSEFIGIMSNVYGDNSNTSVYNNSMFHTSHISGGAFISLKAFEGRRNTGHRIYNNLCVTYNPGVAFILNTKDTNSLSTEFKSDYNLFYSMIPSGSFSNWISMSGQDSHSIYGNPLLKGIEDYSESSALNTSGSELLTNTSFSGNVDGWWCYFNTEGGASGSYTRTTTIGEYYSSPGGLKVVCTANGNHQTSIQLIYAAGINIEKGKWYILSFKAKSNIQFILPAIVLTKMGPPYTGYASENRGELITTDWKTFHVFFFTSQAANDGRITWYLGNSMPAGATFYMDNISFKLADGLNSTIIPDITDYATPGSSPCIDAGLVLSDVTDDYLGRPRPAGSGYDIGAYEYNSSVDVNNPIMKQFRFVLNQNYPNPFNPMTTISFILPSKSFVSLKVFDLLGKEVTTIVSEEMPAGNYSRQWNANGMPSGVYFYRLQAGSYTETKKLILLR